MLGWDEAMYAGMVYGTGVKYLRLLFAKVSDRELMEASNQFWGWWKLQWYIREQDWLIMYEQHRTRFLVSMPGGEVGVMNTLIVEGYDPFADREVMQHSYMQMHDVEELAECLEDSYCRDLVPALRKR